MKNNRRITGFAVKVLFAVFMLAMMCSVSVSAAGNKTVTMKKNSDGVYQYSGVCTDYSTSVYHKIYVPGTGLLSVGGNEVYPSTGSYYSLNVKLYNSNKKLVESTYGQTIDTINKDQLAVYGVKKGYYYIRTTNEKYYALAAQFSPLTNKGVAAKRNAKTITANRATSGVMVAGEKYTTADWFKFNVKNKRVLYIKIETINNGYFDFYLYGPSYPKGVKLDSLKNQSGTYYSINSRTRGKIKVNTGTYYLKAVRSTTSAANKASSGVYAWKWYAKTS